MKSKKFELPVFSNELYKIIITDLLNDSLYLKDRSPRGKISTFRQYAEVVIRKIIDMEPSVKFTLGDKRFIEGVNKKDNYGLLKPAIKEIREYGNDCSHSQFIGEVTNKESDKILSSVINLLSNLFTEYFHVYEFGSNSKVVYMFSLLPPSVRYIVLEALYSKNNKNPLIIDKLSLIILKQFDKKAALTWLEEKKEALLKVSSASDEHAKSLVQQFGTKVANEVISKAPNMYDLCLARITEVSAMLDLQGKLYTNFEEAIKFYKQEQYRLKDNIPEEAEFKDLMDFVYLGRREV